MGNKFNPRQKARGDFAKRFAKIKRHKFAVNGKRRGFGEDERAIKKYGYDDYEAD